MHHKSRKTKRSHPHLRNILQFKNLLVQIIPPAALKMRIMVMSEVNSYNPLSGYCP